MGLLIILLIVVLFIYFQGRIFEDRWDEKLNISVSFSDDMAAEGELFEIVEVVENSKHMPLPTLTVKYATARNIVAPKLSSEEEGVNITDKFYYSDMIPCGGMKKAVKRIGCYSTKRGVYNIDTIYASASTILLDKNMRTTFENESHILIYPSFVDIGDFRAPFNSLMGEIVTKLRFFEDPFEFRGLREYTPSDSMRKINWKASAKGGDFLVNQYSQTVARMVNIIVDFSKTSGYIPEETYEEMLRLTVTVADRLLEEGYTVAIESNALNYFDDSNLSVMPCSGKVHMETIFKATAVVDISKPVVEFADSSLVDIVRNDNAYLVYIGANQSEALIEAMEEREYSGYDTTYILPIGYNDAYKMPASLAKNVIEWKMYEN